MRRCVRVFYPTKIASEGCRIRTKGQGINVNLILGAGRLEKRKVKDHGYGTTGKDRTGQESIGVLWYLLRLEGDTQHLLYHEHWPEYSTQERGEKKAT